MIAQVKDEQSYIVVRERTHRNTAESTNNRVKWWSIFQIIVLLGQGVFQVWWLKRFFEVRSILHGTQAVHNATDTTTGQARRIGRARVLFLLFASWLVYSPLPILTRSGRDITTMSLGVLFCQVRLATWRGVGCLSGMYYQ
jgi:hypothetical protein